MTAQQVTCTYVSRHEDLDSFEYIQHGIYINYAQA